MFCPIITVVLILHPYNMYHPQVYEVIFISLAYFLRENAQRNAFFELDLYCFEKFLFIKKTPDIFKTACWFMMVINIFSLIFNTRIFYQEIGSKQMIIMAQCSVFCLMYYQELRFTSDYNLDFFLLFTVSHQISHLIILN